MSGLFRADGPAFGLAGFSLRLGLRGEGTYRRLSVELQCSAFGSGRPWGGSSAHATASRKPDARRCPICRVRRKCFSTLPCGPKMAAQQACYPRMRGWPAERPVGHRRQALLPAHAGIDDPSAISRRLARHPCCVRAHQHAAATMTACLQSGAAEPGWSDPLGVSCLWVAVHPESNWT